MARDLDEARRMRYQEVIQSFTLLDDVFMTAVFQDSLPCVDLVLQIILDQPNLRAERVITQDTVKNLRGRDVRLDVHAFADGREFNIEIQRAKSGADPRRARYHSSIMDANALPAGVDYEKLPESYVIFITETDVLGFGQPIYVIRRMIEGCSNVFDDGSHIIYVNSAMADTSTPLGRLMHDFRCAQPEKMYYDVLAQRTRAFKQNEEGVSHVSALWEQLLKEEYEQGREAGIEKGIEKGIKKGIEKGVEQERLSSIRRMMSELQLSMEKAMDVLAIPRSEWGRYKAML